MKDSFRRIPVTLSMIAICVIVYLWMVIQGGSTNTAVLIHSGAKYTPLILQGQWWRLITAGFVHIGIQHLVINMITLYFLGMYIETLFGHVKMLIIYLMSIIAGNLTSMLFQPVQGISAGASTGLFGLFGAFILLGIVFRENLVIRQLARQFLILVVFNLVADLMMPGIDIAGHLGGLFGGFLSAGMIGSTKIGKIDLIKRFLSGTILIVFIILMFWKAV
ncbi:rhomboid family intramembrane serine protease [uncultured Limosilactobacillus sp.]|uniref:rhomboid family intramembrane serine protease n=1 Tax=uncultured Limosilactobacillus sp. TaxID=2837629 RepID=UPI0025CF673D|nr:rhomboid family intramembrane serine protease [uncultured Limosilactobacillus sp.]